VAIVPVRDLASKGVLTDPSPYQLDLNAWSASSGMRFHANRVERAPIFRTAYAGLVSEPVFCLGLQPSTGYDTVTVMTTEGRLWTYESDGVSEVTPSGLGAVTITNAGTGYNAASPPAVTVGAPPAGGTQAVAYAVVSTAGTVTGIFWSNAGAGYTSAPTITVAAPTSGTTATATTALGYASSVDPRATTGTFLGDVQYVNRPDQAPRYFGPQSTQFAILPNMDSQWTCRALRAWGDYLIAINVTKPANWVDPFTGATQQGGAYPNMFKWSDLTFDGQVPDSWDAANPNTSAGEDQLEELTTPLVDGAAMRNVFVVYSENEIWGVEQTGDNNIFSFARLFSTGGLIAPNCAVEVDGVHYCFGPKDIYQHDGVTKVSLVDKRNKNTIFRNLNVKNAEVCFVAYVPHLDSVFFCYNTGDTNAFFQGADRCNQAYVYDIPNQTGAFIDLPNVSAITLANMDTILTYATASATLTYANVGGSYYDQQNSYVKSAVCVSGIGTSTLTQNRVMAYDFMNKGWLAFPYEPECNPPAFLQRTGIALDQVGSDLQTYKKIRRIFPEVVLYDNVPVTIQVGWSNTPSGPVTWNAAVSFDPTTGYKVDGITGGRYLALKFSITQAADFEIAGYDLDITSGGRR
jgi:hypothetical protein